MLDDIYIDFSVQCRLDNDSIMEALDHDVNILIQCYDREDPYIPFVYLVLPRKQYNHEHLYRDIVVTMRNKNVLNLLIEMMPLIDAYMEYVCI